MPRRAQKWIRDFAQDDGARCRRGRMLRRSAETPSFRAQSRNPPPSMPRRGKGGSCDFAQDDVLPSENASAVALVPSSKSQLVACCDAHATKDSRC